MNNDITMLVEFERKKAGHYFHKIRSTVIEKPKKNILK